MGKGRLVVLTAIALGAFVGTFVGPSAVATHQPADKVIASASGLQDFEVGSPTDEEGTNTDRKVILAGTLRTASPTDLIIGVDLECALWTATSTASDETKDGVDSSETSAQVKIWVTVDGGTDPDAGVVPVAGNDTTETGKVVFCNRAHRMDVEFFDEDGEDDTDDQLFIKSFLRTRSANGFQWIRLNMGNGIHTIQVWAELQAAVNKYDAPFGGHSDGVTEPAKAAIGKRVMVIEPGKFANDATI